jgi:hypothetical protein
MPVRLIVHPFLYSALMDSISGSGCCAVAVAGMFGPAVACSVNLCPFIERIAVREKAR